MALVDPGCFLGLSPEDQAQQIYEALYEWSSGSDNTPDVTPECFSGLSPEEKEKAIYQSLYLLAT